MYKWNKLAAASLAAITLLAVPIAAFATGITVHVDGEEQQYDVSPYLKNDRTLVPLRGIFESLGATVKWDEAAQTVTAVKGDRSVVLMLGSRNALMNGKQVQLETAPESHNDRMMVPIRTISEALGVEVKWDGVHNAVRITSGEMRDKMLVLPLASEVPTIDPTVATAEETAMTVLQQTSEGLVRYGESGGQVVPGVAKSWEVSADGLVYTFHLRDEAKWSDGTSVTANDFAYAWKRAIDPGVAAPYGFLFDGIADFSAQDEQTFVVTLKQPMAYFPALLARPVFLPVKQSQVEAYGGSFGRDADKMLYNGPFKLTSWEHNGSLLLEKNEQYWDRGHVQLERVSYLIEESPSDLYDMYEQGLIDRLSVSGADYADLEGILELGNEPYLNLDYLLFNNRSPVLKNEKIRKAFAFAVQTAALDEFAFGSTYFPGGVVPFGLSDAQGRDFRTVGGDLMQREQHGDEAKALLEQGLKELGLSELPELTLLTTDGSVALEEAIWAASELTEKLDVSIVVEAGSFANRVKRQMSGEYDIVMGLWGADYEDPQAFLDMFTTSSPSNDSRYSNPEYDRLIAAATKEMDGDKRMALLHQAEQVLMEDMPVAPLMNYGHPYLQKPYVQGVVNRPLGPRYDLKYAHIEGKN